MADERMVIAVDGELTGWDRALDQVKAAGKAAGSAIASAFDQASRSAAGLKGTWDSVAKGLDKSMGPVLGGTLGDLRDLVEGFETMGLVAGTVAASFTAAGGLTSALYQAAAASGELDASTARLNESWLDLRDGIGGYVAPAFNVVIDGLAKIASAMKYALLPVEGMRVLLGELANEGRFAMQTLSAEVSRYGDIWAALSSGEIRKAVEISRAHELATRGMIQAHEVMPGALKKAEDAMFSLWKTLVASEKQEHLTTQQIKDRAKALSEAAKGEAKLAELRAKRHLEDVAYDDEMNDALDEMILKGIDAQVLIDAKSAERHAKEMERIQAENQERVQTWGSYAEQAVSLASQVAQAQADAAEEGSDAQKKAAMVAFRTQQASGLVAVAMNSAEALSRAAAMFPPPTPAFFASAALIAGIGATQAGLIASQKPPEFHQGGVVGAGSSNGMAPDERMIVAREGERVLTRDQQRQQRGSVLLRVDLRYRHQQLGAILEDHVRMDGPLKRAIDGRSSPGRRR